MRWLILFVCGCSIGMRAPVAVTSSTRCDAADTVALDGLGTAVFGLAAVATVASFRGGREGDNPGPLLAVPFGLIAIGYGLAAAHGSSIVGACEDDRKAAREREAQEVRRKRRRLDADRLAEAAQAAARRGECDYAVRLGSQIELLDPEVHDTMYARDVAIVACAAGTPR